MNCKEAMKSNKLVETSLISPNMGCNSAFREAAIDRYFMEKCPVKCRKIDRKKVCCFPFLIILQGYGLPFY